MCFATTVTLFAFVLDRNKAHVKPDTPALGSKLVGDDHFGHFLEHIPDNNNVVSHG
jgi:hypothetical protein